MQADRRMTAVRVRQDGARITPLVDAFDAWKGARRQKIPHLLPIVGRAKRELEHDLITGLARAPGCAVGLLAQLARSLAISGSKRIVEAPETPEACRQRDLRH